MDQEERIKIYNITEEIKGYQKEIAKLKEENKQLKLINEEYERLNKENRRGFKITSVKEFDIYELLKYKNNWNKLRDYLFNIRQRGFELQNLSGNKNIEPSIGILMIIEKMQELEKSDKCE